MRWASLPAALLCLLAGCIEPAPDVRGEWGVATPLPCTGSSTPLEGVAYSEEEYHTVWDQMCTSASRLGGLPAGPDAPDPPRIDFARDFVVYYNWGDGYGDRVELVSFEVVEGIQTYVIERTSSCGYPAMTIWDPLMVVHPREGVREVRIEVWDGPMCDQSG